MCVLENYYKCVTYISISKIFISLFYVSIYRGSAAHINLIITAIAVKKIRVRDTQIHCQRLSFFSFITNTDTK